MDLAWVEGGERQCMYVVHAGVQSNLNALKDLGIDPLEQQPCALLIWLAGWLGVYTYGGGSFYVCGNLYGGVFNNFPMELPFILGRHRV